MNVQDQDNFLKNSRQFNSLGQKRNLKIEIFDHLGKNTLY